MINLYISISEFIGMNHSSKTFTVTSLNHSEPLLTSSDHCWQLYIQHVFIMIDHVEPYLIIINQF